MTKALTSAGAAAAKPSYVNKNQPTAQAQKTAPTQAQNVPREKVYEFHEPIVFPPKWEMELADVQSNYALLQAGKDESLDSIKNDQAKPVLFMGKPIYELIMEMAKYGHKTKKCETAGHFLCVPLNERSPHWEAYGFFMTGQEGTSTRVSMEGSDYSRYITWLKEKHPELMERTLICHVHVHPKMGVFWSGTDKNQQYDKSQLALLQGHRLFLVVNEKREARAKYVQYSPVQFEVDDIAIGISFNNPDYLDYDAKALRKRVRAMVDSLVTETAPAVGVHYPNQWQQHRQRNQRNMDLLDQHGKSIPAGPYLPPYGDYEDYLGYPPSDPEAMEALYREFSEHDDLKLEGEEDSDLSGTEIDYLVDIFASDADLMGSFHKNLEKVVRYTAAKILALVQKENLAAVSITQPIWGREGYQVLRDEVLPYLPGKTAHKTLSELRDALLLAYQVSLPATEGGSLQDYKEFCYDAAVVLPELVALSMTIEDSSDSSTGMPIDEQIENLFESGALSIIFEEEEVVAIYNFLTEEGTQDCQDPFEAYSLATILYILKR